MKKIINLNSSKIARLADCEPFIICTNDLLELEFVSTYYLLNDLVVCLKNGEKSEYLRITDRVVKVPQHLLLAGKLEVTIALVVRGETVKQWDCVPIVLKETETEFNAFEELNILQKRFDEQQKQLEDLKLKYSVLAEKFNGIAEAHNELADTVSSIKENY